MTVETPAALLVLCERNLAKAGIHDDLDITGTSLEDLIAQYLHLRSGHILNMLHETAP